MLDKKKKLLFAKQAEVIKSLAHPLRVAVVDFLKGGEQCVCDIAEHVGSERSNVSRHLSLMVSAGVLDCHKEGLKVLYELKIPCATAFFSCITSVLKQQAKEHENLLKAI